MKEFDIERMCRINGKQPTVRERWVAFHRLWRLAMKQGWNEDTAAADCFRVLFGGTAWRMIRMLEDGVPTLSRVGTPKFLRREWLELDRRRRLYPQGNKEDWQERDRNVALECHETKGIEVTPDEVAGVRSKVIKMVRERAACDGVKVPADDLELLRWLKRGEEKWA